MLYLKVTANTFISVGPIESYIQFVSNLTNMFLNKTRLYTKNFSGSIGSGTGSTQPREDNWVAT